MPTKLFCVALAIGLVSRIRADEILISPLQPTQPVKQAAITTDDPEMASKRQLFAEKLAERERLNCEIDQLRMATMAHEQILVRLEWLRIDHSRLHQMGFEFECSGTEGSNSGNLSNFLQNAESTQHVASIVRALKQNNLAEVVSAPTLKTVSGRPASIHIGGLIPLPTGDNDKPVEFQKTGVSVDLTAVDLGENRVRVELRFEVSDAFHEDEAVVNDQTVAPLKTMMVQTTIDAMYGDTQAFPGPQCLEKQGGIWPWSTPKEVRTTNVLLVTVEPVEGRRHQSQSDVEKAPAAGPAPSGTAPH